MAKVKTKSLRRRPTRKLSDEHVKRLEASDAARAANPNKVGPDAPKRKPETTKKEDD